MGGLSAGSSHAIQVDCPPRKHRRAAQAIEARTQLLPAVGMKGNAMGFAAAAAWTAQQQTGGRCMEALSIHTFGKGT